MAHDNVLLAFVIVAALAFVAQAVEMFYTTQAIREIHRQVEAIRAEAKQRMDPITQSLGEILLNSREPLRTIVSNLAEISRIARDRTGRLDQLAEELTDKARLQAIRADQLLTSLVDKVEMTSDRVQQSIILPVQEIAALVKGLRAGFGFLFTRRRPAQVSETTQDEQLFI